MKYLKLFKTTAEYESYIADSEDFVRPNVSLCEDDNSVYFHDFISEPDIDYSKEYFTIEALEDGLTVKLSRNASQYRIDNNEWVTLGSGTTTPSVNNGQKIQFIITNPSISSSSGMGTFTISKKCNVSGNIMSLLYGDDFVGQIDLSGKNKVFSYLFQNCRTLQSAENLILPATTLAEKCYYSMFSYCISLTTAPELPAMELASECYSSMFNYCRTLTTAPELPATELAERCYHSMFSNCTSLTEAPELPATTLAETCYYRMFEGTNVLPDCSNIDFTNETVVASGGLKGLFYGTKVTDADLEQILPKNDEGKYCLPAITLASDCYSYMFSNCTSLETAPALPATELANYCYQNMFQGCKSLTTAPALPATELADNCYPNMFAGCTSLETAPELPATTLTKYCYSNMFQGCSNLNYIKMLATDISANGCLMDWVNGVASNGTFVKNTAMTSLPSGISGIPEGWTVQEV